MLVNLWVAISTQAIDEFLKKQNGETSLMDDETYEVLDKMADRRNVQEMFKPVTAGGKTYKLFSLNLPGSAKVKDAIDDLTAKWPAHFIVVGAWHFDGRQVGVDEEGNGTPLYPINVNAYRFMPDVPDTYNPDGSVATWKSATSNADLRDINIVRDALGEQQPRQFA